MDVPTVQTVGSCFWSLEPSTIISVPKSACGCRVFNSIWDTAAMDASASPWKPIVRSLNKSSAVRILDVACRSKLMRASVSLMPRPSSIIWWAVYQHRGWWAGFFRTSIERVLEQLFTAEAGRCTTSPAAIWLAMESGSRWMISGTGAS